MRPLFAIFAAAGSTRRLARATGPRGWLLTGNLCLLRPHESAGMQLGVSLQDLRVLTVSSPAGRVAIAPLASTTATRSFA